MRSRTPQRACVLVQAAELAGHWMETAIAEDEWSRQLAGHLQAIETWLITVAAADCASAAAAGGGSKDFAKVLKAGFRDLRQRLAEAAAGPDELPSPDEDDDADDGADEDLP